MHSSHVLLAVGLCLQHTKMKTTTYRRGDLSSPLKLNYRPKHQNTSRFLNSSHFRATFLSSPTSSSRNGGCRSVEDPGCSVNEVEMDYCPINRFCFVTKWTLLLYNKYIPLSDKSPVYFKNIITIGLIPPNKGHRLWPVVIRAQCLVIFDWLTMTSRAGLSARNKARVHCALILRNINRKCSAKHVWEGLLLTDYELNYVL